VIVDYHRPQRAIRCTGRLALILSVLEPFALGLWRHEIADWLPSG
jgi:hypothetical protein